LPVKQKDLSRTQVNTPNFSATFFCLALKATPSQALQVIKWWSGRVWKK